jgi:hypothetical protein
MAETPIMPQVDAPGRVRKIAVPQDVRALSALSCIDYADAFLVNVGTVSERSAEQWARAILEDSPATLRHPLLSGWSAIGLKLDGGRGGQTVLGWPIRNRTPEYVLLAADGRIGLSGELLFKRNQDTLHYSTFVRHDNPAARALWAGVVRVHVPTVRYLLKQASRRCRP